MPQNGAACEKTVISLGGNAIIRRGERGTIEEQFRNAASACAHISALASPGKGVIITHGNGPIVGNLVIQNESASDLTPPMPLYICDADSEGGIGFMIQQTLFNQLRRAGCEREIATVVTQVVVDPADPAFLNPTKPIGPFYTEEEAAALCASRGWNMAKDSGRGWRRVVPSPRPKKIIEARTIELLAESGVIVIAAGGGGIPVIEHEDGSLAGVDGVIDKDLATALLAKEAGVKTFINLTGVDMVYLDYGCPNQRGISEMRLPYAEKYLSEGQFPPGSMGPKIEAAMEFLKGGGEEVYITSPELVEETLKGRAGTRIMR